MCHGLQIICLNETCLNGIFLFHKIFPDCLTTFHSDMVNSNKYSVAVVTAVSSEAGTFKRLYDLLFYDKWSGSKIPSNKTAVYPPVILIPPSHDIKSDFIYKYFCTLENNFVLKLQCFLIVIFLQT